ncbi:DNA topoisomerase II [Pectobacterium bacteriophage PM2]|uniref:DNA topoisomerase (ATP-hydrolyzing) n=1 Tax=Pectobacterium bacteriophage PM2 TaxID=1429794 RepID=A0A0A0Q3N3_9CAUD|nr:DNA topoisomerase II [Pectobacterium bacteriophage PM2]AHY25247.1 topoisomerase II medium subunit [Pectobacterium bacteriophage PM2]
MDIFDIAGKQISDSAGTFNRRDLKSIIDNEALAYAIYTVEQRAIPNMIDGLKPVQRFVIARALELARGNKDKFHKLASIAGGVADLGFHHGEGSAQDAGALMANNWNNNYPLLDGQGNFGSRLVKEAGGARYIFAKVGKNFYDIYKDSEYAPVHKDKEHVPPAFYLPILPMVLINGVSGIATGYATSILPHSLASVKKSTIEALKGEEISEPEVMFPSFKGNIVKNDTKWELQGTYKFVSRSVMHITEVPYKYDRESYIEVLDALEEKGFITYDDDCDMNGFGFKVKFRKDYILGEDDEARHKKIMKDFKLTESKSQNITVINAEGKLKVYEKVSDLIKDFVEVRKFYIQKRIDSKIVETENAFNLALAKARFIKDVIDGTIVIQGKLRKKLVEEISLNEIYGEYAEKLVSMNIYHMTSDEAKKLALEAKSCKEENEYWKKTTTQIEYLKDLEAL